MKSRSVKEGERPARGRSPSPFRGGAPYAPAMARPTRFSEHQYLGDKRSQVVYDLDDEATPEDAIADLMAAESFLAFAPDTLAEARNRGYRLWKGSRAAG
jgi:hypothetical protein